MGLGFSWSTFFVEIVNFLILVWLLTRFFYQPIRRSIAAREQHIKDQLERAGATQAAAEELQKRYEGRLADWEREKAALREAFDAELAKLRAQREDELRAVLERERSQSEAAAKAREREESQHLRRALARDASTFASRLLTRIASPSLEDRIVDVTLQDLSALSKSQRDLLGGAFNGDTGATVTSCYPIDQKRRDALAKDLQTLTGKTVNVVFKEDPALVAGLRIELGSATVDANVGSELRWFSQLEDDAAD